MDKNLIAGLLIMIFVVLIWLAGSEQKEITAREREYCEMTELFRLDTRAGVPELHRRGWPPYNPDIKCPFQLEQKK